MGAARRRLDRLSQPSRIVARGPRARPAEVAAFARAVHADGRGEKVILVAADEEAASRGHQLCRRQRAYRDRTVRRHLAARYRADRRRATAARMISASTAGAGNTISRATTISACAWRSARSSRSRRIPGSSRAARSTATAPGFASPPSSACSTQSQPEPEQGRCRGGCSPRISAIPGCCGSATGWSTTIPTAMSTISRASSARTGC
jgi:hypothetical protein